MVLLLPLPQHEQPPADRLLARQPRLRIRHAPIVHVDAARLHQPPRLALRRRQLHARDEIDDADAVAVELARRQLASTARRRTPPARRRPAASRCPRRTAAPTRARRAPPARAPCTSVVTSRASTRCASRFSGAAASPPSSAVDRRAIEKREELQIRARRRGRRCSARTGRSWNGDVRAGSSQTVPASVLPNFAPDAVVTAASRGRAPSSRAACGSDRCRP